VGADACEVKGVAFHTFFQALSAVRGSAAVELAREELPPELRERLRLGGISRVGYYPMAEYSELHAAAHRALRGGEPLARAIGKAATDIDTRGLLRFVLSLTSADLLLRHAGKVWSSFARGSRVSVQQLGSKRYRVAFEGFAGASELVFVELEGAIERLIERTGARHPEVGREPGSEGSSVRYLVAWE
jgi:hypothetical protein